MKEPDNVQQALLVEDCIRHYLRLLLSTEDTAFLPRLWLSTKLIRYVMHPFMSMMYCLWIQIIDVPTCEWECMWVDIDLIGPQRWPTALTTCCSNCQWGTCVCMWKNNRGVDSSSLSIVMFTLFCKAYCENLSSGLFVYVLWIYCPPYTAKAEAASENAFTDL